MVEHTVNQLRIDLLNEGCLGLGLVRLHFHFAMCVFFFNTFQCVRDDKIISVEDEKMKSVCVT